MPEPSNAVVHFYRASVMHADIWRQRLDATTNWAVVSAAAIVTLSFSRPETPHFVLLLAVLFGSVFLIMESRRYQSFDMWRRRVQQLNRWVIAPALAPPAPALEEEITEGLRALAADLGTSVPPLAFIDAVGYRMRRNYGFLFLGVLAAWLVKLGYQPTTVESWSAYLDRAAMGALSGGAVFGCAGAVVMFGLFIALRARTERMEGWAELRSPLSQALHRDT